MRLSVIVASRDEGQNLSRTIRAVYQHTKHTDMEVLVVDDGSNDGSPQDASKLFGDVRIHRNDVPLGVSGARIRGAAEATGDVFIFLDAHVLPDVGCLDRLLALVTETAGTAVAIPRVAELNADTWHADYSRSAFGFEITLDDFGVRWLQLSEMLPVKVGSLETYESPTLVGCSLAIARDAYTAILGFNPAMVTWGIEDVDLGVRAWMMGYKILCDPAARLAHRFVTRFANFEVKQIELGANQIRMARTIFNDLVFSDWLRMRGIDVRMSGDDVAEHFWHRAFSRYLSTEPAALRFGETFRRSRARDEYDYAKHFSLQWPQ